ncbi:MAG: hypothetical protein ACK52L_12135 [Pirellula sp.]
MTTPCNANNLIPSNYRTSTSPETLPLEDTALAQNQLANRLNAGKTTSKTSNTTPVQRHAM